MATRTEVKHYLAHWFQLGKQVMTDSGRVTYQPQPVIQGERFSAEFERCWADIAARQGEGFYLEGTDQSIAELLSPTWEIASCARCDMPVPIPQVTNATFPCPCFTLPSWPNEEIPRPRLPVNSSQQLTRLKDRLQANLSPRCASQESDRRDLNARNGTASQPTP